MAERKRSAADLALLGGPAAFPEPRHVGQPNIVDRQRFLDRVGGAFDRKWLTNHGPLVQEFESEVAQRCGVAHCVAVTNGTVGLQVAALALDLSGEVVIPAFTFVATAHALRWIGLSPVLVDVDRSTGMIDPDLAAAAIGPRTSAVVGVHLWGNVAPVKELDGVCADAGVPLVFDSAHAFGSTYHGTPVGSFGACEVMSFHATKVIHSFEGGAILTDDPELAERARSLINFGFVGYDEVGGLGTNGKMHEVTAAMGLTSLEDLEPILAANTANALAYRSALVGLDGLAMVEAPESTSSNHHYQVLLVDPARAPLTRDELYVVLHSEGVLARRYFYPGLQHHPPYRDEAPHLPATDDLSARCLSLPTGLNMNPCDVAVIGSVLRVALEEPGALRSAIANVGMPRAFVPPST